MDFGTSLKTCFVKAVDFKGRGVRSEYWYFILFTVVISLGLSLAELDSLATLFSVVLLLPSIAAGVRRLHDCDKSGWWMLLGLIPIVGGIILLIWFVQRGTVGPNRFGNDYLAEMPVAA